MSTVVKYTFPANIGEGQVAMRELSSQESLDVGKAWLGDPARRLEESVKRAVVECNGIPWSSDNRDTQWAGLNAKQRDLLTTAYGRMHMAEEGDRDAFFASAQVTV